MRCLLSLIFSLILGTLTTAAAPPPIRCLAYRPDGQLLAVSGPPTVWLVDPAQGRIVGRFAVEAEQVTALAFSPDGRRLAVASGRPGQSGEVRVYAVPAAGASMAPPQRTLRGHTDLIYGLAFSPDGGRLATGSYDRLIKLWPLAADQPPLVLKDHSDTVTAVAFSRDGKRLASASFDRAVKLWDAATGQRLATLSENTDWVYTLAFSPTGRHLAAAGVDKAIRVWALTPNGGQLTQSAFAHDKPILQLAYAPDGRSLISLAEDRIIKVWETDRLTERQVFAAQPDSVLSLALRPDGQQLAIGLVDGRCRLLDTSKGQLQSQPLPVPPQPQRIQPPSGRPGQTLQAVVEGPDVERVTAVTASQPGVRVQVSAGPRQPGRLALEITLAENAPIGPIALRFRSPAGESPPWRWFVDRYPIQSETDETESARRAQLIRLPVTVVGRLDKAGDVDFYRFDAQAGQEVGVQIHAEQPDQLDPVLVLTDAAGQVLAEGETHLGYRCAQAGTYAVGVRDRQYRGGSRSAYRLHVGPIPIITSVFPLGVAPGRETTLQVQGVNLGGTRQVKLTVPATAQPGSRVPVPLSAWPVPPVGRSEVVVGEWPESDDASQPLPVPGTGNGRLHQPEQVDEWRFAARRGQPLIVEVQARRLGSPLDSVIEIRDEANRLVPRATLRCVAKVFSTFRDHDSSAPGIRLETWNELAVNDLILMGTELIRIRELPRNPDDDCRFFEREGRRLGFLDTTPTHHAQGTPLYKVQVHPPGTTFPPNGLPLVTLPFRNDDGGPGYGKDSRLFFDPPADGTYRVRVADVRGEGSQAHAYRLIVRPPRPDFQVRLSPLAPAVPKGGAVPVVVTATRVDGYEGPIRVALTHLPPGFRAPETDIEAGQVSTVLALSADTAATIPAESQPITVRASALINGREVTHETKAQKPTLREPGDLATTTAQQTVTLKPGGETQLTVTIERRNGFAGRVPIEVRGLPHGVRVLNIGLNGILITPTETQRTIVLHADAWVKPTTHPFVVVARQERTGNEFAASVQLQVVAP